MSETVEKNTTIDRAQEQFADGLLAGIETIGKITAFLIEQVMSPFLEGLKQEREGESE